MPTGFFRAWLRINFNESRNFGAIKVRMCFKTFKINWTISRNVNIQSTGFLCWCLLDGSSAENSFYISLFYVFIMPINILLIGERAQLSTDTHLVTVQRSFSLLWIYCFNTANHIELGKWYLGWAHIRMSSKSTDDR